MCIYSKVRVVLMGLTYKLHICSECKDILEGAGYELNNPARCFIVTQHSRTAVFGTSAVF